MMLAEKTNETEKFSPSNSWERYLKQKRGFLNLTRRKEIFSPGQITSFEGQANM